MGSASKLLAGAAMAIAVLVFTSSSANATQPVEIMDETGLHCDDLTFVDHVADGGCHLTGHSDSVSLIQHRATGDIVVGSCSADGELRIDENGEGWIQNVSFTVGLGCGTIARPCSEEGALGDLPWHINVEHDGAGNEIATGEGCLELTVTTGVSCELEGDMTFEFGEVDRDLSLEADDTPFVVEEVIAHPPVAQSICNTLIGQGAYEVAGHLAGQGQAEDGEIEHLKG
jgi:hypothetical protein